MLGGRKAWKLGGLEAGRQKSLKAWRLGGWKAKNA